MLRGVLMRVILLSGIFQNVILLNVILQKAILLCMHNAQKHFEGLCDTQYNDIHHNDTQLKWQH
jgi:hypothetical protein